MLGRAGARLAAAEEALAGPSFAVTVIEAAAAVDLARVHDPSVADMPECADLHRLRMLALDAADEVTEVGGAAGAADGGDRAQFCSSSVTAVTSNSSEPPFFTIITYCFSSTTEW